MEESRELAAKKGAIPNPENAALSMIDLFNQINDRGTMLAVTISFLGAGGLSLWMTYSILRPLKQIEQAAKRFSSGDLKGRVPASNIPEIHQLGLTLNSVANRLSGVEERRQALIGDLAHELATPLTVIRGYMEMLESGKMSLTPAIGRELHEEAGADAALVLESVAGFDVKGYATQPSSPPQLRRIPHPIPNRSSGA